jgi:hypothetical protein
MNTFKNSLIGDRSRIKKLYKELCTMEDLKEYTERGRVKEQREGLNVFKE